MINNLQRQQTRLVVLTVFVLFAGCRSESDGRATGGAQDAATPDLDAEIKRASGRRQPIFVLVAESGLSREDDRARILLESLAAKGELENIVPIVLDLSVSRNRATAARFHVTNTPVLFGLSPKGLIVTRDERVIRKDLVLNRIGEIAEGGRELEAKLALLEAAIAKNENDAIAHWELAGFLLARKNEREAIPHLEFVARDEAAGTTLRVRAWVELVRAHFWIMEAEKGRHEASDLIAILGPKTANARAGGNLVLGLQDANAKRVEGARREFEAAIAAAPESVYAKQAAEALAKLPGEAK
jgi:tetratricopeptide (TPR) repeat protein